MGNRLKQQRRGKGSLAYRKFAGTFDINVSYPLTQSDKYGEIINLFNHTGHTAPLMEILYDDFERGFLIAPEGIKLGDKIHIGPSNVLTLGSIANLGDIPEGVSVYNIELKHGDGGKLVRVAGASAYISAHIGDTSTLVLPSKQTITLRNDCRAQLGASAGSGISQQPIVKAGVNFYRKRVLNRRWPTNRGVKMSVNDHPFGGKQHHKGQSTMTSRNAPPGRKVGHIAASRVGRRKR